jgi:hypothetical protein
MDDTMGELEAIAVPAMVLLSILRREMEDILVYLSDRGEITQVFNHLLLLQAPNRSLLVGSLLRSISFILACKTWRQRWGRKILSVPSSAKTSQ